MRRPFLHPSIIIAFGLCFVIWFYLAYVTRPVVVYDSLGYEDVGQTIYKEGWPAFFKKGPHREFGYAFLISVAMRLADASSASYITVLLLMHLGLLFLTQLGALVIARDLRLPPLVTAWAILYIGLSPGILFSSFIVYSEVATYPFVPLIVIAAARAWRALLENRKILAPTVVLALGLFAATSVKGIFQPLSYLLVVPFAIILIRSYLQKTWPVFKKSLMFFVLLGLLFHLPVNIYKLCNKIYTGEFTISNQSGRVLLASTISRTAPLADGELRSLVIFTFFPNHCPQFAGSTAICDRWDWRYANKLTADFKTANDVSPTATQKELAALSLRPFLQHPLQYFLVSGIHAFRIFYWEYFYGFAAYPDWMDRFFVNSAVRLVISLTSAVLALAAFLYLGGWVWCRRKILLDASKTPELATITAVLLFLMLAGFGLLSSLFWILDRYILPVASLYILAIAFFFDQARLRLFKPEADHR